MLITTSKEAATKIDQDKMHEKNRENAQKKNAENDSSGECKEHRQSPVRKRYEE